MDLRDECIYSVGDSVVRLVLLLLFFLLMLSLMWHQLQLDRHSTALSMQITLSLSVFSTDRGSCSMSEIEYGSAGFALFIIFG